MRTGCIKRAHINCAVRVTSQALTPRPPVCSSQPLLFSPTLLLNLLFRSPPSTGSLFSRLTLSTRSLNLLLDRSTPRPLARVVHVPRILTAFPGSPLDTPTPPTRRIGHSPGCLVAPLDCRSRIRPRPLRFTHPLSSATHIRPHSSPRYHSRPPARPLNPLDLHALEFPTVDCPRIAPGPSLEGEEQLQRRDELGRRWTRATRTSMIDANPLSKPVRRRLSRQSLPLPDMRTPRPRLVYPPRPLTRSPPRPLSETPTFLLDALHLRLHALVLPDDHTHNPLDTRPSLPRAIHIRYLAPTFDLHQPPRRHARTHARSLDGPHYRHPVSSTPSSIKLSLEPIRPLDAKRAPPRFRRPSVIVVAPRARDSVALTLHAIYLISRHHPIGIPAQK